MFQHLMVSPRKSSSTITLIPQERVKLLPASTKSCESLYSNTSSSKGSATNLYRRKQFNGSISNNRHGSLISATPEVRQRVLSARRLRMKTFQNQLADAQQTIAELAHENRILRTLHKRQDSALAKYESTNAELPKLLHSHAEELRVWQAKYRSLQLINKDLEQKLKQKEAIILALSDQNKFYSQLNKDKNLEDRQRLSEKVEKLELRLREKDNDMKLLARRVQIENKNFKQQLLREQKRTKEMALKLEKTRHELLGYNKLEDLGDKFSSITIGGRKPSNIEQTKLEKDLEKILSEHVERVDIGQQISDIDYLQASVCSLKSADASKFEMGSCSSRSIRKVNTMTRSSTQQSLGGTADCANPRRNNARQMQPEQLQQLQQQQRQPQQQHRQSQKQRKPFQREDMHMLPAITDCKEGEDAGVKCNRTGHRSTFTCSDGFNTNELEDANHDAGHDVGEDDQQEQEEMEDDAEHKHEEVASRNYETENLDEDEVETDDVQDDNDEDESVLILNTSKKASQIREEFNNIRRQITNDYKGREAFLDSFCRQATSGILLDETPKKRNGVPLSHNLPSSRKSKLLAALKAIDDNNSQD